MLVFSWRGSIHAFKGPNIIMHLSLWRLFKAFILSFGPENIMHRSAEMCQNQQNYQLMQGICPLVPLLNAYCKISMWYYYVSGRKFVAQVLSTKMKKCDECLFWKMKDL